MNTKRIIKVTIIIAVLLILAVGATACFGGPSEKDIEIIEANLNYVYGGSGLSLVAKIKNNYSSTVKTSFIVKIYRNGEVFDTTYSDVIILDPGEIGTISSISLISGKYGGYTYKITGWNFYKV